MALGLSGQGLWAGVSSPVRGVDQPGLEREMGQQSCPPAGEGILEVSSQHTNSRSWVNVLELQDCAP